MKERQNAEALKLAMENLASVNDHESAKRLKELDDQFHDLTEQYLPPRPPEIDAALREILNETKSLMTRSMMAYVFGDLFKKP